MLFAAPSNTEGAQLAWPLPTFPLPWDLNSSGFTSQNIIFKTEVSWRNLAASVPARCLFTCGKSGFAHQTNIITRGRTTRIPQRKQCMKTGYTHSSCYLCRQLNITNLHSLILFQYSPRKGGTLMMRSLLVIGHNTHQDQRQPFCRVKIWWESKNDPFSQWELTIAHTVTVGLLNAS